MYQYIKLDEPIPSCEIHSLEFENENWKYIYAISVPYELTNNDNNVELIVYSFISNLDLREDTMSGLSANVRVKALDEYMLLLEKQRNVDLEYREKWLESNPDATISEYSKRVLTNKSHSLSELKELEVQYISKILYKDDNQTTFAAIG